MFFYNIILEKERRHKESTMFRTNDRKETGAIVRKCFKVRKGMNVTYYLLLILVVQYPSVLVSCPSC